MPKPQNLTTGRRLAKQAEVAEPVPPEAPDLAEILASGAARVPVVGPYLSEVVSPPELGRGSELRGSEFDIPDLVAYPDETLTGKPLWLVQDNLERILKEQRDVAYLKKQDWIESTLRGFENAVDALELSDIGSFIPKTQDLETVQRIMSGDYNFPQRADQDTRKELQEKAREIWQLYHDNFPESFELIRDFQDRDEWTQSSFESDEEIADYAERFGPSAEFMRSYLAESAKERSADYKQKVLKEQLRRKREREGR